MKLHLSHSTTSNSNSWMSLNVPSIFLSIFTAKLWSRETLSSLFITNYSQLKNKWNLNRYQRILKELENMLILKEVGDVNGVREYEMGYDPDDLMRHIREVQRGKQEFKDIDWEDDD